MATMHIRSILFIGYIPFILKRPDAAPPRWLDSELRDHTATTSKSGIKRLSLDEPRSFHSRFRQPENTKGFRLPRPKIPRGILMDSSLSRAWIRVRLN